MQVHSHLHFRHRRQMHHVTIFWMIAPIISNSLARSLPKKISLSRATDKPESCLEVLTLICISKRVHQELPQVARAAREEDMLGLVASPQPFQPEKESRTGGKRVKNWCRENSTLAIDPSRAPTLHVRHNVACFRLSTAC